jgi:uncharacterized protein YbaP (TraB family)
MTPLLHRFTALLAALCLTASAPLVAEVPPAPEQNPAPSAAPALWVVADADTTIYLFGTIHVLPEGIDWFKGRVAQAFAASDSLVTEVAGQNEAKMQGLVLSLALLPEGTNLREQLPAQQRAAYEAALAEFKIAPAMLDRFEPWYAAMALSTLPLMQEGFSTTHGVEEALEKRAAARKIAHTGLETVEYQLGLFDGLPIDVQRRHLDEVVGQLPILRQEIRKMVAAWQAGDADLLASLMNEAGSDPLMVEILLTQRNRAWAQWLDDRLDKPGTVFVAVGAGHLSGKGSVQEQLAARGIGTARVQ